MAERDLISPRVYDIRLPLEVTKEKKT